MSVDHSPLRWFRTASPYIYAHRNKTFVIYLGRGALTSDSLPNIAQDITLLHALGVRLILVHDNAGSIVVGPQELEASPSITRDNLSDYIGGAAATSQRLIAHLSASPATDFLRSSEMVALSGNFVRAQPLGIVNGVDQEHIGKVRKINSAALINALEDQALVVLSPLGFSLTGDVFGIDAITLSREVATAVEADKLIYYLDQNGISNQDQQRISELTTSTLDPSSWPEHRALLVEARLAIDAGVSRCHLINQNQDGALLQELFTREGCGTQIVGESTYQLRPAVAQDISGILTLIAPQEEAGTLKKRSRELIESEIDHFVVITLEGLIIACGALYPFDQYGEIACLTTHPDYRDMNCGERILQTLIERARSLDLEKAFILTTQTAHWFVERGFEAAAVEALPVAKKSVYNAQRNAQIYIRALD
jgi:amino-acid N-acetyltransferase